MQCLCFAVKYRLQISVLSEVRSLAFVFSRQGALTVSQMLYMYMFSASHTDKKEHQIFLIYKEIQSGAVEKSYKRTDFLIYEEMRKYFSIYEEAVSHI
jgi:hypothetical protein